MVLDKTVKRVVAAMMILGLLLMGGTGAYSAIVYKLWLADAMTGGTSTSLDGIHSGTSGVPDGAFAIVALNGTSRWHMFRFNSGATGVEVTNTPPRLIIPDNRPSTGVWIELSATTPWAAE